MNFIKQNWFKLILLIFILYILFLFSVHEYLTYKKFQLTYLNSVISNCLKQTGDDIQKCSNGYKHIYNLKILK